MIMPWPQLKGRARTVGKALAPPIGGWNQRDSEASMPETDARRMDNFFPDTNEVKIRKGYQEYGQFGTGKVQTLAEYLSGSKRELICGVDGKLINITNPIAPVELSTGFGGDEWLTANFGGRMFFGNGTDAPVDYDGATLSTTSWSGVGLTNSELTFPFVFKNRLYWIEKDTQAFWYGGISAVTGTLTKFDLSVVGQYGGKLVALGSMTVDAGDGVDDLFVAFMSSGDVLVYQGTDPSSDFALVGRYRLGSPIGSRCLVNYGGELVAITNDGYIPVSQFLRSGRVNDFLSLSDKIRGAVSEAVRDFRRNNGWQALFYPKGNMLLFNIPKQSGVYDQHVMNSKTTAWCQFKNMNGAVWGLFDDDLYFGAEDGTVYKADTGESDDGENIEADVETAPSYLGDRKRMKRFVAVRPLFKTTVSSFPVAIAINTDFGTDNINTTVPVVESSSVWDEAVWDEDEWGDSFNVRSFWKVIKGTGYSVSLRVNTATQSSVSWMDTTFIYESGGRI